MFQKKLFMRNDATSNIHKNSEFSEKLNIKAANINAGMILSLLKIWK